MMRKKYNLKYFTYHILVGGFAILLLYPVFWLVMSSFKVSEDIFITAESFIPKPFILSNYSQWWEGFGGHSFGVFIKNTLVFVAFVLVGHFISCSLIAFGFARLNFVGRGFWFGVMLFTLMLPYEVIMIPQYIIFAKLGWLNSLKPLVVPANYGHPFFTFLFVLFIRTFPRELHDSSMIVENTV